MVSSGTSAWPTEAARTKRVQSGRGVSLAAFEGWFGQISFVPAAPLIGLWLFSQMISLGAVVPTQAGGVAFTAHIGGAAFGVITAKLFERRSREPSPDYG